MQKWVKIYQSELQLRKSDPYVGGIIKWQGKLKFPKKTKTGVKNGKPS